VDTERSVSSRFRAFGVQPLGCVDGIRGGQRNRQQREWIGCDQQRLHENECAGGTAFPCRASVALGRELGGSFFEKWAGIRRMGFGRKSCRIECRGTLR